MNHIIDIILIAVVLLVVFISAKRGIVITLFDIASAVIAVLFSKLISPRASEYIYDSFIKERIIDFLNEKYSGIEHGISDMASNIASFFDFLPKGMTEYAKASGLFDSQALSDSILNGVTTVNELEANIISPVMHSLLNLVCFSVFALVLVVLLRIAGRLLAKLVTKSKLAEKLDTALGAAFGLLKGFIYSSVLAGLITVLSYTSEALASYAADSYICSFVSKLIGL